MHLPLLSVAYGGRSNKVMDKYGYSAKQYEMLLIYGSRKNLIPIKSFAYQKWLR